MPSSAERIEVQATRMGSVPRPPTGIARARSGLALTALTVTFIVAVAGWVWSLPTCALSDPCDLRVEEEFVHRVRLAWDRPADVDGFHHYEVRRRGPADSRFRVVERIRDFDTTTYVDRRVENDQSLEYVIWNVNRRGRVRGQSNTVIVHLDTPEPQPSPAPDPDPAPSPEPTPGPDLGGSPEDSLSGAFDRVLTGSVPGGFTIPAGQRWKIQGLVESNGNVIVEGTLVMRSGDTLRFVNVNESGFVGGGMDPLPSDVGLWVMGSGVLDAFGTPKTGWLRAAGDIPSGASSFTLEASPAGWQPGDEILVVPSAPGDFDGFEGRTLQAVSGATITLDAPLSRSHPAAPGGIGLGPEVANLTRDVNIEGTAGGRTHIFIRSSTPQSIRHVGIRYVGPRSGSGFVMGRYGLHFHHMHDAARGTLVEGVVVRDAGSHAFVPHAAHGITIRDSVAYAVMKEAFWWDRPPDPMNNDTRDSLWDHCLAADVGGYGAEDERASGFMMGSSGTRTSPPSNTIRDSVAVGVHGSGKLMSGFQWPTGESEPWEFSVGNVSHNNMLGILTWSNDAYLHDVLDVRMYHNSIGLLHGAYKNLYRYERLLIVGSGTAVDLWAVSGDGRVSALNDVSIEGASIGVQIGDHTLPPENVTELANWTLHDVATPVVIRENPSGSPGTYDLVGWSVNGRELECSDFSVVSMHAGSLVQVLGAGRNLRFTVTAAGCG